MNITITRRTACQIELQIKITHNKDVRIMNHTSPKYLCGSLYLQLKVDSFSKDRYSTFVAAVKYVEAIANDNLLYNCRVQVNYCNIINITDKDNWYLLFNQEASSETYSFNVGVQFELATSGTPFASLYEDTELTDFNLNAEDGSVSVHSAVAAGVSPVLKKILTGDWQETLKRSVTIPDATKDTLEHFKKYMYLCQLPEIETELEKLLIMGSCYLIPDLVQRCIVKILFKITHQNCIKFAYLAVQYKLDFLLKALMKSVFNQAVGGYEAALSWNDILQASSSDGNSDDVKD